MAKDAVKEVEKELRTCGIHGEQVHVKKSSGVYRPTGRQRFQWRCMVCASERNRARQYKQRRELKADTRPEITKPLAPVVEGAQRPATQVFEAVE